jgi:hypothetical protein
MPRRNTHVTVQDRPLKGAWGMTALLFLFMLINFADKVVVGLAAVPLTRDLGLTPEQFGDIGSAPSSTRRSVPAAATNACPIATC